MRAISLVNRLEFQFIGNVTRNALTLGDVDNDGCNELVIGNSNGDLTIFKGREKVQTISNLGFISCVTIGDIFNKNRNCLVVVTADGWCYIYSTALFHNAKEDISYNNEEKKQDDQNVDSQIRSDIDIAGSSEPTSIKSVDSKKFQLVCIHSQRIPANVKNILLGDIDNDGMIEMILGLTDRVVRSYRWLDDSTAKSTTSPPPSELTDSKNSDKIAYIGKLVALNKWECANQIGSITLHHTKDGQSSLLIAQPGGTFMRIQCQSDETSNDQDVDNSMKLNESNNSDGGSLIGSTIDYQFLGLSRMRNQNISTEILGDFKIRCDNNNQSKAAVKSSPYAVATLDGTIMLVEDEVILWAIAVDHQIFALTKLDMTGNGVDDIVVCSWDGQTYILDQEKNSVRFHLDEPVQAFDCGFYSLSSNEPAVTTLVYVTFRNTVLIYYDIPLTELMCKRFEPDVEVLGGLFTGCAHIKTDAEAIDCVKNLDKRTRSNLVKFLLYDVKKT